MEGGMLAGGCGGGGGGKGQEEEEKEGCGQEEGRLC